MNSSNLHIKRMEKALAIESKSVHPTSKVGAFICVHDQNATPYETGRANYWPKALRKKIPRDQKLGNASPTVHAEVAAMLEAPVTENAALYVTDLPCPNCAKMMAEGRIAELYIDSKAKESALGIKMLPFFEQVSKIILEAAGIAVYEIDGGAQKITPLIEPRPLMARAVQNPLRHESIQPEDFQTAAFRAYIERAQETWGGRPFAAAYAFSPLGNGYFLSAIAQRSLGLSEAQVTQIGEAQDKYTAILQPLDRILIGARRLGLKIAPDYIYAAQVPTAREFVNFIGAGFKTLRIGDQTQSRDDWGMVALKQIKTKKILLILTP